MSRLIQALRNKKSDTAVKKVEPPQKVRAETKKKPTTRLVKKVKDETLTESQFQQILNTYLNNKQAIKKLEEYNEAQKPKLVAYTQSKGVRDDKGNRLLQIGNMVAKVQVSVSSILNTERVEKLLHKLVKSKKITNKDKKKIISNQYSLVLTEDQYKQLEDKLDEMGVFVDTQVIVDEDALQLLPMSGHVTVEEIKNCYDINERQSFVPTFLKKD
jgi:hypothetical protein